MRIEGVIAFILRPQRVCDELGWLGGGNFCFKCALSSVRGIVLLLLALLVPGKTTRGFPRRRMGDGCGIHLWLHLIAFINFVILTTE